MWIQSSVVVDYCDWHIVGAQYIFNTHIGQRELIEQGLVGMDPKIGERGGNAGERRQEIYQLPFC